MQTYRHSGSTPPLGAVAALAAGVATAIPAAFIYAYAFWYIPFVYANIAFTLAFGAGIGFAVAKAAEWGRVRNNIVVAAAGLIGALIGLYVYWGAYMWVLFGIGRTGLYAFLPRALVALGTHLFNNGSWGFTENDLVTGWILVAFWVAEAAVVVVLAVMVSLLNSQRPYCETCQAWTDSQRGVARLAGNGSEAAWAKVLAGELPALAELLPAPPGAMQYVRLDVARCPRCPTSRFLTIAAVTTTIDKKGKASETTRALVTNAIVTPSQCAVVEACGQLYEHSLEQRLAPPPDHAEAGGPTATEEGAT